MDLFKTMEISASGLQAQRTMINVISMNLANVHTTRTVEGGPYRRKQTIFSLAPLPEKFRGLLYRRMGQEPPGVKVDVVEDPRKLEMIFDPSHPDADETGYLFLPNVNVVEEMTNLLAALRSFEANVTVFNSAKNMALKSLEISR